ncbi:ATP-binding protein [Phytoactinopolyspora halotolerans]|uniref:ATP-binding protein n=1 Tax=Phytoactinopolyspora halotolerans TaxID=1981512 RepID=A0A6L9S6X3_9ACTN|nr:ATP-binding protein [Phytoactinopolyspora halotolerans]NEE01215.1 ATP-binding protein [Phytoactinopolyspora halotolerans]
MVDKLVIEMPAVVVFVGAAGSGKTTLRQRLIEAGVAPEQIVSLDELRAEARRDRGQPDRPLMHFSAAAVRRATERARGLVARGDGYVADATHLRRVDRHEHVRRAHEHGLPAICLLLPNLPVELLAERNASRTPDDQVPVEALRRHVHRRSLIDSAGLFAEGFDQVHEIVEPQRVEVNVRIARSPITATKGAADGRR